MNEAEQAAKQTADGLQMLGGLAFAVLVVLAVAWTVLPFMIWGIANRVRRIESLLRDFIGGSSRR